MTYGLASILYFERYAVVMYIYYHMFTLPHFYILTDDFSCSISNHSIKGRNIQYCKGCFHVTNKTQNSLSRRNVNVCFAIEKWQTSVRKIQLVPKCAFAIVPGP